MILKILTKTAIIAALGVTIIIGNSFVAPESESFGNNFTAPENHPSSFHITNFYSEHAEFKAIDKSKLTGDDKKLFVKEWVRRYKKGNK